MDIINELTPTNVFNYVLGYMGALTIVLAMFNNWKNKLDKTNKVTTFKQLMPKIKKWSFSNFDDWLVMLVVTPLFVFLQTPLLYVGVYILHKKYQYDVTEAEYLLYTRIHYLVSFGMGSLSQGIGVLLIYLVEFTISKVIWFLSKIKKVFN